MVFSHCDVSVNVNDKPFRIFNRRTILFVCLNIKWFNLLRILSTCIITKTSCCYSLLKQVLTENKFQFTFFYISQHVIHPLQRTTQTYSQPQWMDKMSTNHLRVQTIQSLSHLKIIVSLFYCLTMLQLILLSKSLYSKVLYYRYMYVLLWNFEQ